jgi:superfamily II DNA or RNA helicase
MYQMPKRAIDDLERVKRELTMTPIEASYSGAAATSFDAYEDIGDALHVPRFYGVKMWGPPAIDATTLGQPHGREFAGSLNPLQDEAVNAAIDHMHDHGGTMLVLPCGYGKTVCALYIAAKLGRRTLVLVHKNFLVEQWQERTRAFIPGATIGHIQQDRVNADADIVVAMVQSIAKREYAAHIFEQFGLVIIDEAHHMSAPIFSRALRQLPMRHILALSATPERRDGLTPLLHWSMGRIGHRIERKPEETNVSCMLYEGGTRKEIMYKDGRVSLPLMLNALTKDTNRTTCIAERLVACYQNGRHIIVLSDRIAQLKELAALIQQRGVLPHDMAYYIGNTPLADRERAAERKVLLSTYSMAKEGLDIPRLDTLILATPKGDVVQACGRVQRKHPDKATPLIIDVIDTFSVFERLRWKRWAFYREQSYNCQTYGANNTDANWHT